MPISVAQWRANVCKPYSPITMLQRKYCTEQTTYQSLGSQLQLQLLLLLTPEQWGKINSMLYKISSFVRVCMRACVCSVHVCVCTCMQGGWRGIASYTKLLVQGLLALPLVFVSTTTLVHVTSQQARLEQGREAGSFCALYCWLW